MPRIREIDSDRAASRSLIPAVSRRSHELSGPHAVRFDTWHAGSSDRARAAGRRGVSERRLPQPNRAPSARSRAAIVVVHRHQGRVGVNCSSTRAACAHARPAADRAFQELVIDGVTRAAIAREDPKGPLRAANSSPHRSPSTRRRSSVRPAWPPTTAGVHETRKKRNCCHELRPLRFAPVCVVRFRNHRELREASGELGDQSSAKFCRPVAAVNPSEIELQAVEPQQLVRTPPRHRTPVPTPPRRDPRTGGPVPGARPDPPRCCQSRARRSGVECDAD